MDGFGEQVLRQLLRMTPEDRAEVYNRAMEAHSAARPGLIPTGRGPVLLCEHTGRFADAGGVAVPVWMPFDAPWQVPIVAVVAERARQNAKWGQQNHADAFWLGILTEELGEVAKAVIEADGGQGGERGVLSEAQDQIVKELTQVAAVAVAWVECIRRGTQPTGRASNGFVEPRRAGGGEA